MRISINLSVNAFVVVLCCLLAIQEINGYHFASPNQNKNVVQVSSTKKLSMESSLLSDDAETTVQATTSTSSRRNLLRSVAAVSAGVMLGTIDVNPVNAADDVDVATPLYFGVGVSLCYVMLCYVMLCYEYRRRVVRNK